MTGALFGALIGALLTLALLAGATLGYLGRGWLDAYLRARLAEAVKTVPTQPAEVQTTVPVEVVAERNAMQAAVEQGAQQILDLALSEGLTMTLEEARAEARAMILSRDTPR